MKSTILLIEDNEQNLYLETYLLESNDCKVFGAKSGPEGILMADRIQPDLIILDIQLPQMDGYAVARELRKKTSLEGVPIVAVTSYAMTGDRERCLGAGCNGYLEKPINPDTFKSEIEKYLKARSSGGGP